MPGSPRGWRSLNRLVETIIRSYCCDGTKDLLAHNLHVSLRVGKHGGDTTLPVRLPPQRSLAPAACSLIHSSIRFRVFVDHRSRLRLWGPVSPHLRAAAPAATSPRKHHISIDARYTRCVEMQLVRRGRRLPRHTASDRSDGHGRSWAHCRRAARVRASIQSSG